jgi:hypothetical protein
MILFGFWCTGKVASVTDNSSIMRIFRVLSLVALASAVTAQQVSSYDSPTDEAL